jgi:hypothetical protein
MDNPQMPVQQHLDIIGLTYFLMWIFGFVVGLVLFLLQHNWCKC